MNLFKTGDKVVDKLTKKSMFVLESNSDDLVLAEMKDGQFVEKHERNYKDVRLYLEESLDLGDVSDHLKQ